MKPSRYLAAVQRAVGSAGNDFTLTGNYLLVEKIPQDEVKTKSGLIIATHGATVKDQVNSVGANLPCFVHVLATGAGYDDEGVAVPLDTQPSDILLVGQYSVKWLPVYPIDNYEPFSIGVTSEAETQMRFRGYDSYQRFAEALNRAVEAEVPNQGIDPRFKDCT